GKDHRDQQISPEQQLEAHQHVGELEDRLGRQVQEAAERHDRVADARLSDVVEGLHERRECTGEPDGRQEPRDAIRGGACHRPQPTQKYVAKGPLALHVQSQPRPVRAGNNKVDRSLTRPRGLILFAFRRQPRPARNSCGVMPVCLRKKRAKCEGSENASWSAISWMGSVVKTSWRLASVSTRWRSRWPAVTPAARLT